MANSLTPMSPTYWSKIMGKKRYKSTVFRAIASFEEQSTLTDGLVVDRPYRSNLYVQSYTKGVAATAQDLTASSNQLTINKNEVILMYVDDVDKVQNKWDAAKKWAEEAGIRMGISEDAEVLYEVVNAANNVDNSDIASGTVGDPFTITTSNIATVVGKINQKLDSQNADVEMANRFWVVGPQIKNIIWLYVAGKESILGDKTTEFGNFGRFGGLELYMSNNLTASALWTPANNPSNLDTVTIDGVVFTFVSTIGTTAGNVLQTVSTSQTLTNLAALINTPGTTTANGVAFATSDLATVNKMVAVATATAITVYHKGQSFMTVTGSDATDVWSKQTQLSLAGVKGAIDVVTQKEPTMGPESMASTVAAGKRGMNIMPLQIYGIKTFDQGTKEIVAVKVASSLFV